MKLIGKATCLLAIMAASGAMAQADPAQFRAPLKRALDDTGPATTDRPITNTSAVQLTAGQDNSSVSFNAGLSVDSPLFQQMVLTASAPIDQGADSSNVASLDGLARGFSVELKASGAYRKLRLNDKTYAKDYFDFCDRFWAANGGKPADRTGCRIDDIRALKDPGHWLDDYEDMHFDGSSYFWGLTAKVGDQQFKFYDPGSLSPLESTKTPWSVGAFWAIQPSSGGHHLMPMLLTFRYDHQHAFDDADSKTLCPAPAGPGPVTCITGPIGAPGLTTKELLSLELRAKPGGGNFAFAANGSYDARNKVWSIDAPIYLVTDGSGGLAGGVKLGWRSDNHAVTVGVFVSKPFDLGV